MGLKKRAFTGTLRKAVLRELGSEALSKSELLGRLRQSEKVAVSNQRLQRALEKLIRKGKVVVVGQRATARFRRTKSLT